jgi:excisionase family DNA binding protein
MADRHRSSNKRNTSFNVAPSEHGTTTGGPSDPRALGFVKAAYGVKETLDLLSVGRTSLYAAVKRGELTPVKLGKKTLFYAVDLAAFLTSLKDRRAVPPRY